MNNMLWGEGAALRCLNKTKFRKEKQTAPLIGIEVIKQTVSRQQNIFTHSSGRQMTPVNSNRAGY